MTETPTGNIEITLGALNFGPCNDIQQTLHECATFKFPFFVEYEKSEIFLLACLLRQRLKLAAAAEPLRLLRPTVRCCMWQSLMSISLHPATYSVGIRDFP